MSIVGQLYEPYWRHFCTRVSPKVTSHDKAMRVLEQYPFTHTCSTRSREETYGEIVDMRELVRRVPCPLTPSSVLVDVGSGYGRFALYAALTTPCRGVVGIELNACRHAVAEKMRREQAGRAPHLHFRAGDVRHLGLPDQATHLYMCSTCFSPELCRDIVRLAPPALQCILTLKTIDADGWTRRAQHPVKFSWNDHATVHYYTRS